MWLFWLLLGFFAGIFLEFVALGIILYLTDKEYFDYGK